MKTFRLIVCFLTIIFCSQLVAQNQPDNDLGLEDIYIVRAIFDQQLLEEQCDCCSTIGSKKCILMQGEITEVLAMSDTSVFRSTAILQQVQFFVLPYSSELDSLEGELILSCSNTCTLDIIKVNRVLPSTNMHFKLMEFYIGGLSICYDFNWFQRLQLRLGIRREKIYQRAVKKNPETSRFVKFLVERGFIH